MFPGGYLRVAGPYDDFAENVTPCWKPKPGGRRRWPIRCGGKQSGLAARSRPSGGKSKFRIDEAGRRRKDLADLQYRTADAGAASIDFAASGRATRKLLVATDVGEARRPAAVCRPGRDPHPWRPARPARPQRERQDDAPACPGRGNRARHRDGEPGRGTRGARVRAGADGPRPGGHAAGRLCPNGDTVEYRGQRWHVVAWAKRLLFRPEQLEVPVGSLSGGSKLGCGSPSSWAARPTSCSSTSRPTTWTSPPWRRSKIA